MKKLHTVLLSLAGTAISAAAILLFGTRESNKNSGSTKNASQSNKGNTSPQAKEELYKTAGIKRAELKDIQKVPEDTIPGFVIGKAATRSDEHDKYNVDIVSNKALLIGHIEKNRRLCNSLNAWHQGSVFSFVKLKETADNQPNSGTAYIPVGLKDSSIKKLKLIFEKLAKRHEILAAENISSQKYLEILDDHRIISEVLTELDLIDLFDISLSKRIIPALSKQLEEEKNWEGLLILERHSELINDLSERFAATTYARIAKAKKNTGQII